MTLDVLAPRIVKDSEAALAGLEAPLLLLRIWQHIRDGPVSFFQWRIFSKLLLAEESSTTMSLYRYRRYIPQPASELSVYTGPITSPSCEFITSLSINMVPSIRTDEYLALASMPNLGALDIIEPFESHATLPETSMISDRLFRGWSEVPDPFRALRILSISNNARLSRDSLRYASNFRSLELYSVVGDRYLWRGARQLATDLGWKLLEPVEGDDHDCHLFPSLVSLASCSSASFRCPRKLEEAHAALSRVYVNDEEIIELWDRPKTVPGNHDALESAWQGLLSTSQNNALDSRKHGADIPLDARGFWLYSILTNLHGTDLEKTHLVPSGSAHCRGWRLPQSPFVSLHLGEKTALHNHGPGSRALGLKVVVFMRTAQHDAALERTAAAEKLSDTKRKLDRGSSSMASRKAGKAAMRPKKLQKLNDVFAAFEESN
ncbi:hypothetical protein GQ53DRAFT_826274 [Thozetella sp. PMI_491]|nr:hypothetical protein GQ53DRAFT_826274 [Thozetella sp. PMI_491]